MRAKQLLGNGCIKGVWMKIKILDDPARFLSRTFSSIQGQAWWTYQQATPALVLSSMLEFFPTEAVR